jgi:hypothetical protein
VRNPPPDGARVKISIAKGPRQRLQATAEGGNNTAEATVRSSSDEDIELQDLRYTCAMPPETFCPARRARVTDDSFELTFKAGEDKPPIVLSAVVS